MQVAQINKFVNGKIYELVNLINGYKYKGSTIEELNTRKSGHDTYSKISSSPLYVAMQQYGCDNFRISLIKNYPCNNKIELATEEAKIIAAAKAAGEQLYNKNRPAVANTAEVIADRARANAMYVANAGKHRCDCCKYAGSQLCDLKRHLNSVKCKAKMPAYLIEQITVVEIQRMNDIIWE